MKGERKSLAIFQRQSKIGKHASRANTRARTPAHKHHPARVQVSLAVRRRQALRAVHAPRSDRSPLAHLCAPKFRLNVWVLSPKGTLVNSGQPAPAVHSESNPRPPGRSSSRRGGGCCAGGARAASGPVASPCRRRRRRGRRGRASSRRTGPAPRGRRRTCRGWRLTGGGRKRRGITHTIDRIRQQVWR